METFVSAPTSSDNQQPDSWSMPEVCERLVQHESGSSSEFYLRLGDAHSRAGEVAEAAKAYNNALKLDVACLTHERLHSFAVVLIEMARAKPEFLQMMTADKYSVRNAPVLFTCRMCRSLWVDPITLGCGHTFCRHCVERDDLRECHVCRYPVTQERLAILKTSFLLAQTVEKWFPKEYAFCERKSAANRLMAKRRFAEALEAYSEAVQLAPSDMELRSCRADAYAAVGNFSAALDDADVIITNRPTWAQGYQRRAEALRGLNRPEDAMSAYVECLSIDPNCRSAFNDFTKVLHTALSPVSLDSPEVHKRFDHHHQDLLNSSGASRFNNITPKSGPSQSCYNSIAQTSQSIINNLEKKSCMMQTDSSDGATSSAVSDASTGSERTSTIPACGYTPTNDANQTVDPACQPSHSSSASSPPEVPVELLNIDDFECTLCSRMLFHPVITPCGHVFCRECLYRSLDYRSDCPLCKESLAEYLAERSTTTVEALEHIFNVYFHEDLERREQQHTAELEEAARILQLDNQEVPIFVCTMAFPMVPCPLHVFEPRYRLMIRRCIESGTRQFGMCILLDNHEENFASYGTMLEVRDVQYYADGRALVDAVGGRRFHVLSRGQKDGYRTAKVEFLQDQDEPATGAGSSADETALIEEVYAEAHAWFTSLRYDVKARILQHYGEFPDPSLADEHHNGPAWMWYTTSILPLDPQVQLSILAKTSLRDRINTLRRWIARVRTSFAST